MRHMREDSNFAPRPDLPPDLPMDEIKKKPFLFTFRQVVIFIILFILMLAGIMLVEMAAKSQQLRLQKQHAALCESRGEHYRYREGTCQLRVWVCTESQTSTGYEKECKYEWRKA